MRSDARRNLARLLEAAKDVFEQAGVDAPLQQVADRAGLGIGTIYRHFPRRADLVAAVMEGEIEACARAAEALAGGGDPDDALDQWVRVFTALVRTKQGLAAALHSDEPALGGLVDHVRRRLEPGLEQLLAPRRAAGTLRPDVTAGDVIVAVALLCHPVPGAAPGFTERAVGVHLDGLRGR